MRFLLPLDSRESIRVILRKYSDTFPLYDAIIEDLMNNDYKIKPGKGAECWHQDPVTGERTVEYKDLGTKDLYLGSLERGRICQREIDRIPQTQRKLARILDKQLYESFNEEIKRFYKERDEWRGIRANEGISGLKREFGDDWKQQFDEIKKKRQRLQRRRDALRHVHYDQIVKLQEWRKKDGKHSHKSFTIIDTNTDLDDLIEKQHVRANKPIGVKMPILIDNNFFDAV